MTQTITLKIWDEENQATKEVKVSNVFIVKFYSKYCNEIDFFRDSTEIFIDTEISDIEFSFHGNYVFIAVKDCEAQ